MRIVNFGQVMDVENRSMVYQFTVELSSGDRTDILTDEDTVQQLVNAMTGVSRDTQALPAVTEEVESLEETGDYEHTFGGDLGEMVYEDVLESLEYAEESVPEPRGALGQVTPKRPPVDSDGFYRPPTAKTVPKDDMGYPIVPQSSGDSNFPLDDGEDDGAQI